MPDENSGSESHQGGAQLQLINLLIMQVVELNRQRALLLTSLQYGGDVTKRAFSNFMSVFIEVFKLTSTMISEDLVKEVDTWIEAAASTTTPNTATTRKEGIDLADKLLSELTRLGLLQLFEEQVAPPFMLDFDLEERKEKMAEEADKKAGK
jgi:hypothetical protein